MRSRQKVKNQYKFRDAPYYASWVTKKLNETILENGYQQSAKSLNIEIIAAVLQVIFTQYRHYVSFALSLQAGSKIV